MGPNEIGSSSASVGRGSKARGQVRGTNPPLPLPILVDDGLALDDDEEDEDDGGGSDVNEDIGIGAELVVGIQLVMVTLMVGIGFIEIEEEEEDDEADAKDELDACGAAGPAGDAMGATAVLVLVSPTPNTFLDDENDAKCIALGDPSAAT